MKKYVSPDANVVEFNEADIFTTSGKCNCNYETYNYDMDAEGSTCTAETSDAVELTQPL